MKRTYRILEKSLLLSRYGIAIAVLSTMLSAVFLFVWTLVNFTLFFWEGKYLEEKEIITNVVSSIDLFFLWIISLMVSFSLYEMYLKKDKETFKNCPNGLIIYSLDELKRKVVNVVLMILIITFFKFAINYEYKTIFDLLGLSVSIFFVALTVAIGRIKIGK